MGTVQTFPTLNKILFWRLSKNYKRFEK